MRRDTKIAAAAFIPIPLVIVGAALICTWVIAQGAAESWRLPFRLLCHGMASRSFELWGVAMPICARCTAIYTGLLAGLLFFLVRPGVAEGPARLLLFGTAAVMFMDGFTQALRLRESTNELRTMTGVAFGMALGVWALSAIEHRLQREFSSS